MPIGDDDRDQVEELSASTWQRRQLRAASYAVNGRDPGSTHSSFFIKLASGTMWLLALLISSLAIVTQAALQVSILPQCQLLYQGELKLLVEGHGRQQQPDDCLHPKGRIDL